MNDDASPRPSQQKTWLERLAHSLLREPKDREQLLDLIRDAAERHVIDYDDLDMLEGVLEVSETQVRDIFIPRGQMIVLHVHDSLATIIPKIMESGHSRFPLIEETRDEIIGVIVAKDLLPYAFDSKLHDEFNLKKLARKPMITPESKRVDVLLKEFQISHNHMAIVVDEYGKVAGLVTIEDVIEEIVGDIADEHDSEEKHIRMKNNSTYLIDALTPIEEFNDYFSAELNDEEFDTMGGLVTQHIGHLPKEQETVTIHGFTFRVLRSGKRRISLLEMDALDSNHVA
jgi:magnesium and cobalt transporter